MSDTPAPSLLSAECLAEIAQREQAATPGPWTAHGLPYDNMSDPEILAGDTYIAQTAYDMQSSSQAHDVDADTEFIAHARQDIPDLLADRTAFRQAVADELRGLRATFTPQGAPGPVLAMQGIMHDSITRLAARLQIDLTA